MTLADAWYSSDVIIWDSLTPYRFIAEVSPAIIYTVKLDLFVMEICYASSECYINIQAINSGFYPSSI